MGYILRLLLPSTKEKKRKKKRNQKVKKALKAVILCLKIVINSMIFFCSIGITLAENLPNQQTNNFKSYLKNVFPHQYILILQQ